MKKWLASLVQLINEPLETPAFTNGCLRGKISVFIFTCFNFCINEKNIAE